MNPLAQFIFHLRSLFLQAISDIHAVLFLFLRPFRAKVLTPPANIVMGVARGGAMSLLCQKDSYVRTHTSKVLSCVPVTINKAECYEVTLEDTVFFPEGGGQVSIIYKQ